jgi:hypothetical protein
MLQPDVPVTALAGPRDDRPVGLRGGPFGLEAGERVVERLRAEHDRERIGVALLVDGTEARGQVALGDGKDLLGHRELAPRLYGLAVDRGGLRPKRRQLCLRPREPAVEAIERQNRGSRSRRDCAVLLRQPLGLLPERRSRTGAACRQRDAHRGE